MTPRPPTTGGANANANEAPIPGEGQAPQANSDLLTIIFRDVSDNELQFRLKSTTKLGKAMERYSTHVDRARGTLRFLRDGDRVLDSHTPGDLEMEDGDVIDVHTEQLGGCVAGLRNDMAL